MKLRNVSQVVEAIDDDLAWRKRELTTLNFMWKVARDHERAVALRTAVVLGYAHWEGFVKQTATAYLNFLHYQGLTYGQLRPGVVALSVRGRLRGAEAANRVVIHTDVVDFLLSGQGAKAEVPWNEACEDIANLDSRALEDIVCILGLDYAPYALKAPILDERLVRNRHLIAHGRRTAVTEAEAQEIHELALELMEKFRKDSENSLATGVYVR